MAASMGAVLQCAGPEQRNLKHARIMIHQPLGGADWQASDIEITARRDTETEKRTLRNIAHHSGQTMKSVGR